MLLRGGVSTEDPRLDRVPFLDPRSLNFPIRTLITEEFPRSYTWRGGPVTDQGREGACVGHGWTGELTARPKPVLLDGPSDFAFRYYKECQRRDPWPGENYEGTSVLAGAQYARELGYVPEYRWAFGLRDLLLALGRGPVVLGINWYDSMYSAPAGRLTVSGTLAGGHCILARGQRIVWRESPVVGQDWLGYVDLEASHVLLRNSWGLGWGINGDAMIRLTDLDRLLRENGEACVPVRRNLLALAA